MPNDSSFLEDSLSVYASFLKTYEETSSFKPIKELRITPETISISPILKGKLLFRHFSSIQRAG